MKVLNIFDFDETISKKHTFRDRSLSPETNIKKDIEKYLRHDDDVISAIATYHDDPGYIKAYVEKVLGKTLTAVNVNSDEHHVITEYSVEGHDVPFYICSLVAENFGYHHGKVKPTGKNTQILAIKSALANKGIAKSIETNFYDDSNHNFEMAKGLPNLSSHLIPGYYSNFRWLDNHAPDSDIIAMATKYATHSAIKRDMETVRELEKIINKEITSYHHAMEIFWNCEKAINDSIIFPTINPSELEIAPEEESSSTMTTSYSSASSSLASSGLTADYFKKMLGFEDEPSTPELSDEELTADYFKDLQGFEDSPSNPAPSSEEFTDKNFTDVKEDRTLKKRDINLETNKAISKKPGDMPRRQKGKTMDENYAPVWRDPKYPQINMMGFFKPLELMTSEISSSSDSTLSLSN
jgi:hypothetical protein